MTFLVFFGVVVGLLVALEWATRPKGDDPPTWHKRNHE